ncbi:MAG: hypothetical protein FWD86_01860, partial [Firmicutes bacterium]|nr:hypothetical protein [Bacillota bacterium]
MMLILWVMPSIGLGETQHHFVFLLLDCAKCHCLPCRCQHQIDGFFFGLSDQSLPTFSKKS